eukprot:NODE_22884_length_690_cov_3.653641.p2 GENE.NODE_22884_length_690_cov_3.653641~~NODE_22884_length_690_cov_3.653641.p2  ORF type:complete len:145 (-),score=35.09 NODE_22884_length_690_cov_3.653641:127-561(-)
MPGLRADVLQALDAGHFPAFVAAAPEAHGAALRAAFEVAPDAHSGLPLPNAFAQLADGHDALLPTDFAPLGPPRARGTAFLCTAIEQPCPEINPTKAAEMNARLTKYGSLAMHQECCHAVKRAQRAADRLQARIESNWYLRHFA